MSEGHNTTYSVHPGGDKLYKDGLTKTARFILIKDTWSMEALAKAYVKNVTRLHGVPTSIVSDRDSRCCII